MAEDDLATETISSKDGPGPFAEDRGEIARKAEEEKLQTILSKRPRVVGVRKVDFEHFKNRYSLAEGQEIIEYLIGHDGLAQDISREHMRRKGKKKKGSGRPKLALDSKSEWIQRVRIQSPQLLRLLSRLSGSRNKWNTSKPRVFFRPFCMFKYLQPQMKECLELLEQRWRSARIPSEEDHSAAALTEPNPNDAGGDGDDSDSDDNSTMSDDDQPLTPEAAVEGNFTTSFTALEHVRKYVRFVDESIIPLWHRAALNTSHRQVRFLDLWMYYQPGELLYCPQNFFPGRSAGDPKATKMAMDQSVWRLYSMALDAVKHNAPDDVKRETARKMMFFAYYIDYNGLQYGRVERRFSIWDFEGEKDITSFRIFPLRFVKEGADIMRKLQERGRRFQELIQQKYLYYDGWTIPHGPVEALQSEREIVSMHIEGDVVIDFAEGC